MNILNTHLLSMLMWGYSAYTGAWFLDFRIVPCVQACIKYSDTHYLCINYAEFRIKRKNVKLLTFLQLMSGQYLFKRDFSVFQWNVLFYLLQIKKSSNNEINCLGGIVPVNYLFQIQSHSPAAAKRSPKISTRICSFFTEL